MVFSFCSCKRVNSNGDDSKLKINLYLIRDYYVPYGEKLNYVPANDSIREKRFDIKFSILNNTDSMIAYWTMTCNWERSFLINNSYISFIDHDWEHNFPHLVRIKPHDSIQIKATLVRNIRYDNPCKNCIGSFDEGRVETTKIGLILIDSIECREYHDYFNRILDKSKWKITWSNPLYLNK
jgi:hypothetical protein